MATATAQEPATQEDYPPQSPTTITAAAAQKYPAHAEQAQEPVTSQNTARVEVVRATAK